MSMKNNLIKVNKVHISAGIYKVTELCQNDWNFNVGDFTICVTPDFDNDPNDPNDPETLVSYCLIYSN